MRKFEAGSRSGLGLRSVFSSHRERERGGTEKFHLTVERESASQNFFVFLFEAAGATKQWE